MPRKKTPGTGKRGPRPTPTATLERQGSPLAAKRKTKGEPTPTISDECPKPPPFLSKAAKAHWEFIAPELHKQHLLTLADRVALAQLCERLADYHSQAAEVDGRWTVTTDYGFSKNPAASLMERTWDQILVMCREFGMTPSARVNLNIKPVEKPKGEIVQAKVRFGGGKK